MFAGMREAVAADLSTPTVELTASKCVPGRTLRIQLDISIFCSNRDRASTFSPSQYENHAHLLPPRTC